MAEVEKVDSPEARDRCQGIAAYGQCVFRVVPGGTFCSIHGGKVQAKSNEKKAIRNYILTQWQARIEQFADNDSIKSLREEIGILRLVMENKLNLIKTPSELLQYSGPIQDTALRIKEIVLACHKIEAATGQLLDKQALLDFANSVVTIISSYITDSVILDQIANDIINLLRSKTNASSQNGSPG